MNLKYLAYNIAKTDYKQLNKYVTLLQQQNKKSKFNIYLDILSDFYNYNTRFIDYFYLQFFTKDVDKSKFTNVWDMYKFHHKYNDPEKAILFRNKCLFREKFDKFFNYPAFILTDLDKINDLIEWIEQNKFSKIVAKEPMGSVGKGVKVLTINFSENNEMLIENIKAKNYLTSLFKEGFSLYESFIQQHDIINDINPKAINTVRIVTFVNDKKEVEIWGTLLRMAYDKQVDNFDAGGLSANIDCETGIINKKAIIKDPFSNLKHEYHPITKSKIKGLQIPYWDEILSMILESALLVPEVRTVGWDVAITTNGPTLIEGNDNWDKTHFQLVSEIGLNERIKTLLK